MISDLVESLVKAYQAGYANDPIFVAKTIPECDCYLMGLNHRSIDEARNILQTYGRGRIVEDSGVEAWIQIDHDREHLAKLLRAVEVLDGFGMIERHRTKGNPRNVRIIERV